MQSLNKQSRTAPQHQIVNYRNLVSQTCTGTALAINIVFTAWLENHTRVESKQQAHTSEDTLLQTLKVDPAANKKVPCTHVRPVLSSISRRVEHGRHFIWICKLHCTVGEKGLTPDTRSHRDTVSPRPTHVQLKPSSSSWAARQLACNHVAVSFGTAGVPKILHLYKQTLICYQQHAVESCAWTCN